MAIQGCGRGTPMEVIVRMSEYSVVSILTYDVTWDPAQSIAALGECPAMDCGG